MSAGKKPEGQTTPGSGRNRQGKSLKSFQQLLQEKHFGANEGSEDEAGSRSSSKSSNRGTGGSGNKKMGLKQ